MSYIKVKWIHENDEYPIWLYSELDDQRWEVRKVEIFRNGDMGWADGNTELAAKTGLGEVPTPPLEEIARDPEFEAAEITKEEFEVIWTKATQ